MEEVEQQRRADGVLLILRRKHPLGDIPAAARLRARIPHVPPLHRHRKDQDGHQRGKPAVRRVARREHRHLRLHRRLAEKLAQRGAAAEVSRLHRIDRREDRPDHRDRVLIEIGPDRSGQPAQRRIDRHRHQGDAERRHGAEAEHHLPDLDRRQRDRRHDHHIEEHTQIERPESPQHRCGPSPVPNLIEPEVGVQRRPPPQLGVHENRQHPGQQERPPAPVPGDPLRPHDIGHQIRRVAREGAGHHRDAQQPPRHRATGKEEIRRALT